MKVDSNMVPNDFTNDICRAVMTYAEAHYAKGWDVVVECWSKEDIIKAVHGASTVLGALRKVSAILNTLNEYAEEIQAA